MDNNYAEQAIRPFTLGWKNFVLIESSNEANASAILYSLSETAKANELNTFEYFNLLLTEIPRHMDDSSPSFLYDLLPWSPNVQKSCPSKYKKLKLFKVQSIFHKISIIPGNTGIFAFLVLMFEGLQNFCHGHKPCRNTSENQ